MRLPRSYPGLVFVGLAIVLGATLLVAASTSSAAFGAYNPTWDGTSEIRAEADSTAMESVIAQNVTAYEEVNPNETVAVVLSPTTAYNASEAAALESFVQSGGTLLIADDFGTQSNPLLDDIDTEARITGTQLRDEQRAGPSPAFPRAHPVANHTYTDGVDEIMLNHGSTVEPGNATTLLASSEFSYLDTNRNAELDESESLESRPVATVEAIGTGDVIVLSDPSVFLNSMLDRSDNAAFLRAMLAPHRTVVLDVSHTSSLPPLVTLQLAFQQSAILTFAVGTLTVLGVIVLARPLGLWQWLREWYRDEPEPPTLPADEIAAAIRARHPEWDTERVERVTDSLMTHRRKGNTDE